MAHRKRVEVFTAGCPVCDDVVGLVKRLACESCEVLVYDLNEPCESGVCLEKVKTYGINRIPAVVVDGRHSDCCVADPVTAEGLRAAGIGIS